MLGPVLISPESAGSADAQACVAAYYAELAARFELGFDPASSGYKGQQGPAEPGGGAFLLARASGQAVGCGELKVIGPGIGEIKRMWVAPSMRGLGLARRILQALETEALAGGLTILRLDTNRALTEAHALYRRAGYREVARYNDNPYAHLWFEKQLEEPG